MVDASRAASRLGLAVLLLVGSACIDDGAPRTRPPSRSEPIRRCPPSSPGGALRLPVWDLFVVDAAWDALHHDVTADVDVDAQLCLDGRLEPIELELQGTSGRTRDKKSFKIEFDRDHALAEVGLGEDSPDPIDKVFLKAVWIDQSLIREAVAFDLWREMGHTAPRTGFANLRINGDYWGLYNVVEPVDKDYLQRNGYPAGGTLYKGTRKHGSRADFAPRRNLRKAFENKTDDDGSYEDLERLVEALQDAPLDAAAFEREIDPLFSLDDYIDRMVWVSFTRNGDAVAQNFYLYNAPEGGRDVWHQIPWDSDLCLGSNWKDRDEPVPADKSLLIDGGNFFGRRLTKVPGLRERYVDRFVEVLDEVLPESVVLGHLERRAALVRHDLREDRLRWRREVTPDEAFEVIRNFVATRPDLLRHGLEATFGSSEPSTRLGSADDDDSAAADD